MSNEVHQIKRNGKLEYRCYNNTIDAYLVDETKMLFDSLEACIEHLASHERSERGVWTQEERITWWEDYLAKDFPVPYRRPPHWRPFPYYDLDSFIELVEKSSTGENQISGLEPSELEVFQKVAEYLRREGKLKEKQPSKNFDFDSFRKTIHRLIGSEGMVVEAVTAGRRVLTKLEITLWTTLRYLINVEQIYRDI